MFVFTLEYDIYKTFDVDSLPTAGMLLHIISEI